MAKTKHWTVYRVDVHPEEQRFFHTPEDAYEYADFCFRWKPVVYAVSVPVPDSSEALVRLLNDLGGVREIPKVKKVLLRNYATYPGMRVTG